MAEFVLSLSNDKHAATLAAWLSASLGPAAKLLFQLPDAGLGGDASLPLYVELGLGGDAPLGVVVVGEQVALRHRVEPAQLAVFPAKVQVQDFAMPPVLPLLPPGRR